jgi:histidine triad (HIT) family protein
VGAVPRYVGVMTTLFSKIIDGAIPGRFVWADDLVVAFLTIEPITDGHTLVVPRAEIEQLTDAPDDLLAHLISVTKTIGIAQRAAWGAPRAAVLVAGFEIPHLHVHVLPAWDEASLTFANARRGVPGTELDASGERLRAALRTAGHAAHVPASLGSPEL